MNLYYYTNVETMRCILQNANIYATNLRYMNDAEEYANGVKELREIFNERKRRELITEDMLQGVLENEVTSYSISFSEAGDLLSQWSMYAGESGVSLRMRFTGTERYKAYPDNGEAKAQEREELPDSEERLQVRKVYYCTKSAMKKSEYKAAADEIWKAATGTPGSEEEGGQSEGQADIDDEYPALWKRMAPFVKRVEFRAEAEQRLVFNTAEWEKTFRIDYRNSRNALKPYLDIECKDGWPIYEVMVGPGFNQEVVYQSILHFLNHAKLKVPALDGKQYCERCEEYFQNCGNMPEELRNIWNEFVPYFDKDTADYYRLFLTIRNDMLKHSAADKSFGEQLRRRELTKTGIILSRSRIPYIF
ncbi:MAG: hypothetical protein HDR15_11045 [Lachnospiraceae bacterium]|nr:hypothetical protein [Lachnospiraceae bacterium]